MAKMLWIGTYMPGGVGALMNDGATSRLKAVEQLVARAGGKIEVAYWAFGDDDFYIIVDMPDHATSASISLVSAAEGVSHIKSVVLLTAEEMDEAVKKAVAYRPPGG